MGAPVEARDSNGEEDSATLAKVAIQSSLSDRFDIVLPRDMQSMKKYKKI